MICATSTIVSAKTTTTLLAASRYLSSQLVNVQTPITVEFKTDKRYTCEYVYKKTVPIVAKLDDDVSKIYLADYTSRELMSRIRSNVSAKIKNGEYIYTIKIKPKYLRSAAAEKKFRNALKREEKKLKLTNKSRIKKLRAIHDFVVKRIKYTTKYNNGYNAYFKKKSACVGYSRLFYLMCRDVGIPCRIVYSSVHVWNIVKVNNRWYHVDTTWDDEPITYKYFLRASITGKDHKLSKEFTTAEWKKRHPMAKKNYFSARWYIRIGKNNYSNYRAASFSFCGV